jgi:transcription antitermination protein NusB
MPAKQKFSPKARHAARQRVLQALYQWQLTGQAIEIIESQFLVDMNQTDLSFSEEEVQEVILADLPYFKRLLNGITQQVTQLDQLFRKFLDRDINVLDPIELAILRIGCYELNYCPDVPFKVAINEAVELAKKFGAEQSHKYVNGILDKLVQHKRAT